MLFQFTLENIPDEMLQNICRFLDPKEVTTLLQTISKPLRTHASSSTIWLPYLKRLKAIDNEISVTPPKENQESWCYRRFVEEFNKIAQSQQEEIQFFRRITHARTVEIKDLLIILFGENGELCKTPATNLEDLENRHQILKKLTAAVEHSLLCLHYTRNQLQSLPLVFNELIFTMAATLTTLNPLHTLPSALSSQQYGEQFITSSFNSRNQVAARGKRILENDIDLDEDSENQNGDDKNHSNNNTKKPRRK